MANVDEQDFAELYENSLKSLEEGSVVEGTIVDIVGDDIFVDLGYKADGIVPRDEFSYDEEEKPQDKYKKGDKIEAYILRLNNGQGNVLLSTKRLQTKKLREEFEAKVKADESIKVKVTGVVNGGVTATYGSVKIFIPASQLGQKVDNLEDYRGKNIEIKVIEYNPEKKKIVGSERVLVKAARDKAESEVWAKAVEGAELEGTIREIKDYGCFVDLGGVDGLLHVSEISWTPIHSPAEVFKIGDKVKVKVLSVDKENKKIALGYRKPEDNPWLKIPYEVGQVVEAEVVSMKPFGAFVALENGLEGLVHISNITHSRIAKPQDVLSLGQKVTAKVIEIDVDKKRIELSIREMEERMPEEVAEQASIAGVDAKEVEAPVAEAPAEAAQEVDENQVTIDEVKNTEE